MVLDIKWVWKYKFHFCLDLSSPNPIELLVELSQFLNYSKPKFSKHHV